MKLSILLFLCVLGATTLAATKVYKWVDKDGNIHYSEKKPPNQQADTLRIKEHKPQPATNQNDPAANQSDLESESAAADDDAVLREQSEKALAAADQVNKQKLCQQAKANRDALNASVRVSRIDPKTGEQVRMTDDERVNALQKAEKTIKEYCQ